MGGPTMAHRLRSACFLAILALLLPAVSATGFASAPGSSKLDPLAAEKTEALAEPAARAGPAARGDNATRPPQTPVRGVLIRFGRLRRSGQRAIPPPQAGNRPGTGQQTGHHRDRQPRRPARLDHGDRGTPPRHLLGPYRGLHPRPRVQRGGVSRWAATKSWPPRGPLGQHRRPLSGTKRAVPLCARKTPQPAGRVRPRPGRGKRDGRPRWPRPWSI